MTLDLHPRGPIPGRVARGRLVGEWPGATRTRVHQVARLLIGNSLRKVAARWRWLQHLLWLMEAALDSLKGWTTIARLRTLLL